MQSAFLLLAADPVDLSVWDGFTKLVEKFGWAGAIVVVLLVGLIKYGPTVINAQITLTNTATEHIKQNALNLQRLADSYERTVEASQNQINKNQSLLRITKILLVGFEGLPPDRIREIERHAAAIDALLGHYYDNSS
jgi:hypothetical protein